jgi:hypothetical protein
MLALAEVVGISIEHASNIFADLKAYIHNYIIFSMKRKINLNNCDDIPLIALINCASSSRNIFIVIPAAYLQIPG